VNNTWTAVCHSFPAMMEVCQHPCPEWSWNQNLPSLQMLIQLLFKVLHYQSTESTRTRPLVTKLSVSLQLPAFYSAHLMLTRGYHHSLACLYNEGCVAQQIIHSVWQPGCHHCSVCVEAYNPLLEALDGFGCFWFVALSEQIQYHGLRDLQLRCPKGIQLSVFQPPNSLL